jgi:glycerophosphoryl diester phosphodiesterase
MSSPLSVFREAADIFAAWASRFMSVKDFTAAAHRGLSGCTDNEFARQRAERIVQGDTRFLEAPENTLPSYKAALIRRIGIEGDVVPTALNPRTGKKDMVMTHSVRISDHVDDNLHLPREFVDELTLDEVKALKTGPEKKGETPALAEFFQLVKRLPDLPQDGSVLINLELKDTQGTGRPRTESPSLVFRVLETIKESGLPLHMFRFSSFSLETLRELYKLEPEARIGMLFAQPGDEETRLFAGEDETYLLFNRKTAERVLKAIPTIEAFHPSIDTLDDDMVDFLAGKNPLKRKLQLATWAFKEESPRYDQKARQTLRRAVKLCCDRGVALTHITDFVDDVKEYVASLRLSPVRGLIHKARSWARLGYGAAA